MTPAARRADPWIALGVAAWVTLGLWLDHDASLAGQRGVGVVTWALLLAAMAREGWAVRAQLVVALVVATAGEYGLSPGLGLYDYRFAGVPSFLLLARSVLARPAWQWVRWLTLALAAAWATWGVTGAARGDRFGFVLFLAWAAFAAKGGAPMIAVACWWLTTWLELVGTGLGNWAWATATPLAWLTMGNPPTGIAGGYCVLDVLALRLGEPLSRVLSPAAPAPAAPVAPAAAAPVAPSPAARA
jgi:hypothetical protein